MSLEDNQFLLFDPGDGGASMEVPVRRESAFREKFPNARRLQLFDVGDGGEAMEVPEDRLDAFRAKYPKAERLYLFDEKDGGAAMEVPRAKLGAYIQKKATPDKGGLTLGSGLREAATAAVRVPAAAVAGAAQGVAGTLADLGPGDAARRERQRALDAAPERIPTMKEAGREIGLSQKEIDALPDRLVTLRDLDDPRFGQAYRDRVRATMNRVAANAPETQAEKAHREEAERLQAKADKLSAPLMEPRNAAERAAMHFGGGVATVGELGLAGALGGPAAVPLWMGATGAAREAARQEAEGKTPREAMAGALAPAGAEALAWTVPIPVGQGATALGRVGREALTMGVKSDLAGTARRTLSGEEAPALSDRIAEDLGAAAMGGALGAAREGAGAAGRRIVRAVERDARNRAANVAALDPAAALGKLQRRAEADYIDAQRGRAAEAAADLARMNPAGTVGRTADALEQASYALEALGRVEAGQRAAGAPPAPAGALPAPAEPGAVPTVYGQRTITPPYYGPTVSRPGEPITPPAPYADKVPEPIPETQEEIVRRRKEALDALPLPQRLKKTGFSAYYDQYPDRAGVLDAIGFENFAKLYRKYKGDFRDVTGDLVDASEVGGIVGRDYSGADGVRRALEDAAQEYERYRAWKEEGAPTAEEEMQTGQYIAWNKQQNAEAEAEVRRRYELTHPEMTGEPRVTEEEIRAAQAAAEQGEVERIEAEAREEPAVPSEAERRREALADPDWETQPQEEAWDAAETDFERLDADFKAQERYPGQFQENDAWVDEHGLSIYDEPPEDLFREPAAPPASGGASRPGEPQSPVPAPAPAAEPATPPPAVTATPDNMIPKRADDLTRAKWRAAAERAKATGKTYKPSTDEALDFAWGYARDMAEQDGVSISEALRQADSATWTVFHNRAAREQIQKRIHTAEVYERGATQAPAAAPQEQPQSFQLDGGTPAEIDAEKARVAEAQKRAALEEAAAAPGRDLGTVSIQEGLPGIGGDGTLFTTPAGGWSGRRAGARADVAAETPRAAAAPAPESPHEGLRTKLKVLVDSGATPEELETFAREAEASDAFATAALARQRAGTYRGTPWGTEGGDVWPAEPPPMAKLELGDMVDLARELSASGAVPKVVRKISRILGGKAAGVFRNAEGVPTSGKVEMLSRFAALVDGSERAAIEDRALARAKATGSEPGSEMFQAAYDKALADGLGKAVEASLKAGPKPAMAVLAHEIGHWVDFLDEGTLKRGNVLGHIAALKKYGARNLYPSQAAADAAGSPKLTKEEVRARAVEMTDPQESFKTKLDWLKAVSRNESAARAALIAERDMATLPQMREQMERLVAWFRQSDGAPEYFAKDPSELYAEAFSAWMNYPSNARRLAPRFADLMDGWIESHGAAGRAVKRFQTLAAERSAARDAAAAAGGTPPVDEAFFERRRRESAAASMAEDPALRKFLASDADPVSDRERGRAERKLDWFGPRTMLEDMVLGMPDSKANPDAIPVFRALLDLDNAGNMGRLWRYRFDTRVMPALEAAGIPLDDFRDFLKYRRLGWEITGEKMDKGAANKFGPGGVTPGYQATGARARVDALRAKYGPALDEAARAFWNDVRMGADAGGEGSILKRLMDSPVLSAKQKETLGNELYVSLRRAMVPDTTREVASGREMSNWNGIWSLRTGSFQETGDVIANTLLQDYTMFQQVMRQEARLRLVDYLRAHKPEWVGAPAEMKDLVRTDSDGNLFHQSVPKQQKKEGWRVVTFMRDGKAEGWWVPDFVAKALEPQTFSGERTKAGLAFEQTAAALSRASNAALTTGNLVFNPVNALSRDPNGLSRYALPRQGEGAKGALYNTAGDASLAVRSLADNTATQMEKGAYDKRVVHALASGALNDTAAGWGPNGGVGGVAGMAEDIRRTGRTDLSEDEVRRLWQGFGHRADRVDAALAREGSAWRKLAGGIEKIWNGYGPGRINQWLGKREMSSKAASLADLDARRPDMDPVERAWWVKNMMGTPDLSNRPLRDRSPWFRMLAPFYTPLAHGIRYQVGRAFQKMPGTLGRRLSAQMVPKALAVAAPYICVAMAKGAYEEYKRMKASGRFSQEALDEQLGKATRWTAFGQSWAEIPLRHRVGGFTMPLPGGWYAYAPTDQGLLAIESAVLGGVGAATKQGRADEAFLGALGEFLPNFGPLANTAIGLATTANGRGYDLNMGTPIVGEREQHPALRTAGWTYNNLTGRGLGLLPAETIERWITGAGPEAGEAAKRAWKIPGMAAIPGAFVRKRGSGAWAARAGAVQQGQAEESEMRGEATQGAAAALRVQERARKGESDPEADKRDRERTNEAGRRIQELGGDAGARLRSAAERQSLSASDLSPSERLIVEKKGRLSDAAKEWLDPAAHAMLEMPEVWQKLHEKPEE